MGFSLIVGGFFSPPLGVIDNSVIVVAGILFALGAMCVGVDLKGIIQELRQLQSGVQPKEVKDEQH